MMVDREARVTMKGTPFTVTGDEIKTGDKAPDFTAVKNDLSEFRFYDHKGKIIVLSSVPSLDTSVCSKQTRRFNEEAKKLGDEIEVITVSMDLPFAQARWKKEHNVEDLLIVSDHRAAEFGLNYGMLMKEPRLLARGVVIVDRHGGVRYIQLVDEITNEPDYGDVLENLKKVAQEEQQERKSKTA